MQANIQRKLGIFVLGFGFSLVALQGSAANKVKLRMKLREGDRYTTQLTTKQSFKPAILDPKHWVTKSVGFGFVTEVTDINNKGWMTTKVTYQSIQIKENLIDREIITYDSKKPSDGQDPSAQFYQALINKSFVINYGRC
jgi:Family of unknown function (DUF6263)